MRYTVRYAHLHELPTLQVGDILRPGELLGRMGNSGQSTNPHLHIDCVEGEQAGFYTLADIEQEKMKSAPRQLNWFIDATLFRSKPIITTWYADPTYQIERKKLHLGYDIVPARSESSLLYWNRTFPGKVIRVADAPASYGYHIQIVFNT